MKKSTKLTFLPFCAIVAAHLSFGTTLTGQTTILSEGFEGSFPTGWTVADSNPTGTAAYWGRVNSTFGGEGTASGGWKAYCAGVGYSRGSSNPRYQDNMTAVCEHDIALSGYAAATLTFALKIPSIDSNNDRFEVVVGSTTVYQRATALTAWTPVTVDLTPHVGSTRRLSFRFVSNGSRVFEGVYLDDILVTAGAAPPPPPPPTPPVNDAFASATTVSSSSGTQTGTTVNATKETGEPNHAGNTGGHSVWYLWSAPTSDPVTFETTGSNFDTLLAAYTGTAVTSLTAIASNNDTSGGTTTSKITFSPIAGTIYRIAVDGANGASGNVTLKWSQAAPAGLPDLIVWGSAANPQIATATFSSSSCAVVEGLVQAGTRRLLRFSTQSRNQGTADLYLGNPSGNPLFEWAPCHGHYHFQGFVAHRLLDSNGQAVATGLKIGFCLLDSIRWDPAASSSAKYTCSNQGIQKGWGDVYNSTLDGQWIDITSVPDGSYTLELEINPNRILAELDYNNNITQIPVSIGASAPPANDSFANAQGLSGGSASVPGTTVGASKESGEPNHAGNAGGASIWYRWTAVASGSVVIDTVGSSFDTLLAAYTGSSVSSLSMVASNDDLSGTVRQSRIAFQAVAGTVYQIAVDGYNGVAGTVTLTLSQGVANDNFANAEFSGGATGTLTGSNVGASKESGEPNHAGNSGGRSIWYYWTAPNSGPATFETVGSTFDTLLAVYTGNAVNGLTLVVSNDDIDYASRNLQSRVSFNAVALTSYKIAIDGYAGASGNTKLSWVFNGGVAAPAFGTQEALPEVKAAFSLAARTPALEYQLLPGGEMALTFDGEPGGKYTIEYSDDLAEWHPLATTLGDARGSARFTDKETIHTNDRLSEGDPVCGPGQTVGVVTANAKPRFYRARYQE